MSFLAMCITTAHHTDASVTTSEFKKMMAKRNRKLEMEAMNAIQEFEAAAQVVAEADAAAAAEAAAAVAAAAPAPVSVDATSPEASQPTELATPTEGTEDMEAAMAASAAEYARVKALADMELADMEAAIAASLELEKERLHKLAALAAAEAAAAARKAASEGKQADSDSKVEEEEEEAPPVDMEVERLLAAPDATAAATADHAARGVNAEDEDALPAPKPVRATQPAAAAAPAVSPAPAKPSGPYDPFADTPDMGGFGAAARGGASLPPLAGGGMSGLSKLPDILQGARANVQATQDRLDAIRAERAALRASDASDRASLDAQTQAKLEERAAHLRQQRDLILAKKQAERDAALAKFQADKAAGAGAAAKPDAARMAAAMQEISSRPSAEPTSSGGSLTASLAARARSDYLTSSERQKLSSKSATHVSLQERLAEAEQTQSRHSAAQAQAMQALRQVAAGRAAAVISSSSPAQ